LLFCRVNAAHVVPKCLLFTLSSAIRIYAIKSVNKSACRAVFVSMVFPAKLYYRPPLLKKTNFCINFSLWPCLLSNGAYSQPRSTMCFSLTAVTTATLLNYCQFCQQVLIGPLVNSLYCGDRRPFGL